MEKHPPHGHEAELVCGRVQEGSYIQNRGQSPGGRLGKQWQRGVPSDVKPVDEKALVDISSVKGGDSFMSNIWHWGMESKLAGAWLSPNCAAQIRIVAMGSVTMIAFELKQLIDILGEKCTCDDLTKFVLGLSREGWG